MHMWLVSFVHVELSMLIGCFPFMSTRREDGYKYSELSQVVILVLQSIDCMSHCDLCALLFF